MLELSQPPPHASLLQELLLALAGHTGDAFVDEAAGTTSAGCLPDPLRSTVHLADDIDWINSSEGCATLDLDEWLLVRRLTLNRITLRCGTQRHLITRAWRCREMLSDLAKLGFHFRALESFVDDTCSADAFLKRGLYRHALASGLTGSFGCLAPKYQGFCASNCV